MLHRLRVLPCVCLLATLAAVPASAQPVSRRFIRSVPTPARGFISINGGYQGTTTEFGDTYNFTRNQETGTTRLTYPVDAGPTFDIGGGVKLWRHMGVGVAVSRFTRGGIVSATAAIPHPFFLQQHRDVEGESNAGHEETGIHLQAQYALPLSGRLQVTLMGGPSVLQVNQTMVVDVNYTEEYPYDTATFAGVEAARKKGSKTGFNLGADVRWMLTRTVGLGALVRFTRATIDLEAAQDRTVSVEAGGTQVGVGLRVAF